MRDYVAAIDQGTTGTRCILFDLEGRAVASAYREHRQIFPRPGWVEHDPLEIRDRVDEVVCEALARRRPGACSRSGSPTSARPSSPGTRGPGNPPPTRSSGRTRAPRGPVPRGDRARDGRRTCAPARVCRSRPTSPRPRSGGSSTTSPGCARSRASGHLLLGTIDTWVIWNLTGGPRGGAHVTDPTNASRTLLCNLASLQWDPVLFERFGVPWGALPRDPALRSPASPTATRSPTDRSARGFPSAATSATSRLRSRDRAASRPARRRTPTARDRSSSSTSARRPVASSCGLLATAAVRRPGRAGLRARGLRSR